MSNKPKNKQRKSKILATASAQVQNPTLSTREIDDKSIIGTKWIPFFRSSKNLFINDLADRAKRSSTHSSVLNSKVNFTVGSGFQIKNVDGKEYSPGDDPEFEAYLNNVNNHNERLIDVFKKVATDHWFSGNSYYQFVPTDNSFNIFHEDTTTVRLGAKVDGFIEKAFLSTDWREIKLGEPTKTEKVTPIEMLDPRKEKQSNHLVQMRQYSPEHEYYGLPDYIGAIEWIDIEYKIPTFNLDLFANGFFPSALIQLKGDVPDGYDTAEDYVKDFVKNFTGEGNTGKLVVQLLEGDTEDANVQLFDNIKEGHFQELDNLAVKNIITAHRWYPELSGIQTPGKLGGNQQIRDSFEIAMNTVIKPVQDILLAPLNDALLKTKFNSHFLTILTPSPVSFAGKLNLNDILTEDEKRAEVGKPPLTEEQRAEMKEIRESKRPINGSTTD